MSRRTADPRRRDWTRDFDHADPAYNRDAPEIWADLRSRCPVVHSPRYGGMWIPFTHEDIREIAYDTTRFTSNNVVVSTVSSMIEAPVGPAPPITSDPPFHAKARRLLLPLFSPKRIAAMEGEVRAVCRECLDALGPVTAGSVIDGAGRYAQHVPLRVIAPMLGFSPKDHDRLLGFVHDLLEGFDDHPEEQRRCRDKLDEYIEAHVARHRRDPNGNLTSRLLAAEIDGEPLGDEHVVGSIVLIFLAGIDTTWSAIGSALWHLAKHPADRQRLIDEPGLMPSAVEELLRAYAPVTMARQVKRDCQFRGHVMKAGEWVLLPFPAANRDPAAFERADEVVLDREVNRHAAFGLGMHRCLGSNLARLELRVAIEELLDRFPAFELAPDREVEWSVGQVRGPRELPLRILSTSGSAGSQSKERAP
ncbi:MAG: cytochrome P450 [Holophagales bacterium]|nr:cytochrome P450 [Holophagales bacterium]